jgi:glyoxylase I family protein
MALLRALAGVFLIESRHIPLHAVEKCRLDVNVCSGRVWYEGRSRRYCCKNRPAKLHYVMFTGIEHFAIASPNPKALADWYVKTLGFQHSYDYQGNFFIRAQNGSLIEIIPSEGPRAEAEARTPGIRHIAIAVDDFEAAHAELKSRGVRFTGAPYENQGNRLIFFKDVDGNILHLIKREATLP